MRTRSSSAASLRTPGKRDEDPNARKALPRQPVGICEIQFRSEIGHSIHRAEGCLRAVPALACPLPTGPSYQPWLRSKSDQSDQGRVSALGHQQTSASRSGMSALPLKADMFSVEIDVS